MKPVQIASSLILALCVTPVPASQAQSLDPTEAIQTCAAERADEARLACFDNLAQQLRYDEPVADVQAPEAPPEPEPAVAPAVTTAATETEAPPMPDDLGGSSFEEQETNGFIGTITRCEKGHYGNWFFYFENGQIWQEVNIKNHRFKDCNFNATITKDFFGYRMQIEGMDKKIRVKRNR